MGGAERVTMQEAPGAIARRVEALRTSDASPGVVIVGIAGAVGAGKSTLARAVSACVIATDDYLPDYELIPMAERDLPEHAHLDELREHLELLRRGEPVDIPVWSFDDHRRVGTRRVDSADVVACEGLFALHETVLGAVDIGVFVEAPRDDRLRRFEARELAGERGWTVEHAREHFERVADPTFERFEAAYRAAADVLVVNPDREGADAGA